MNKFMNILNSLILICARLIIVDSIVNQRELIYLMFGIVLFSNSLQTNILTDTEDKLDLSLIYVPLEIMLFCKLLGIVNLPWILVFSPLWIPIVGVAIIFIVLLIINVYKTLIAKQ